MGERWDFRVEDEVSNEGVSKLRSWLLGKVSVLR